MKAKTKYITPWSEPASKHAVKGYRKLRNGEILRKTDRVWLPFSQQLVRTAYYGERVCAREATACHYYRRKSTKR